MSRKRQERLIQILLVIATLVMTILRFLLNEKGRVSPDSIRYMRQAKILPVIDNTTAPLGYPFMIKLYTFIGLDEFWSSKLIGILSYLVIVFFAYKKKFYAKETVIIGGLFSFVSIFSFTLSEALILPFVFLLVYLGRQIIIGEIRGWKALFYLSFLLILLYNIRYSALFFIGAIGVFGLWKVKKEYGKTFILSGLISFSFVVFYKFSFIDYFNENYVDSFLDVGLHSTSQLLIELFQGLTTTFNPFVHMANPSGGFINWGIYGIGLFSILIMMLIFIKNKLSETEQFVVFLGAFGIVCSFFIQYFYSTDPLSYRLLAPFSFPVWLVFVKKIYQIIGLKTYAITALSLLTGLVFIWLSRGNYFENRAKVKTFLDSENIKNQTIKFYISKDDKDLSASQLVELISTVHPKIEVTVDAKDSLQKHTLTEYKVLQKIKIDENKYQ